jgi:hypothetical protein
MSNNMPPSDRVEQILRAGRLRWRKSAQGRAPAWFRGGEFDFLEPIVERGGAYHQARAGLIRSGLPLMFIFLMNGAFFPSFMFCIRRELLHSAMALLIGYVSLLLLSPWLWRTALRRMARRALRDSPDWPLKNRERFSQPT